MDNLSSLRRTGSDKPRAVKKASSLPDCPVYKYSFSDPVEERNRLPYPLIEMTDFFKKKTLAESGNEISNAVKFNKRLREKKNRLLRENKNKD